VNVKRFGAKVKPQLALFGMKLVKAAPGAPSSSSLVPLANNVK
jgi:hypothetical protein